jgi:hypothetical protein
VKFDPSASARRVALVAAMVAATGIAQPLSAAPACGATGPVMLGLYLAGRELGDAVHGQVARMAGRRDAAESGGEALADLDAALAALNTQVWGLYWVSLYSRRLHEVLDQLDAKPPGPVTRYYDRWDESQLTNAAALTLRHADAVGSVLARAGAVAPAQSAKLRQYLDDIGRDLRGCAPEKQP